MTLQKPVSIIVAALKPSFGIGYKNQLPWKLSNEMKYFRKVTIGSAKGSNAVIMGRKTWESIPSKFRPLKDRINVIITRNEQLLKETASNDSNVLYFTSIEEALKKLDAHEQVKNIYIIGGAQIYNETLPLVDNLLLTEIHSESNVPMDSFLDGQYISQNFAKATHAELEQHIGFSTESEQQTEGDFTYTFTLYRRRQ